MKFDRYIFLVALLWYSITAYYSIGYFHADEHYQLIEFAGILDGSNTAHDLPWEYSAQIRPATQPTVCYLIFSACEALTITDPYHKAFILRLITGVFAACAIFFFTKACKPFIPGNYWKLFLFLSYFLWFLPFINVRFSSETWSGIALLTSLVFILKEKCNKTQFFFAGIFMGLSFLFRFQIAFSILPLLLWLRVIKKVPLFNIGITASTILTVICIGIAIDSWFYKEPVLTLWNYLHTNLIEGKATEFGTSPWYFYFYQVLRYAFLPVGIIIISSFMFLLYKKPKSIFVWVAVPFIFIHTCIGHKELRFLFPLINLVPIIIILALEEFDKLQLNTGLKKLSRIFLVITFAANVVAVLVAGFKPVGVSRIYLTKKIHDRYPERPVKLYFLNNSNPYAPWGLTTNFYTPDNIAFQSLSFPQMNDLTSSEDTVHLFVVSVEDLQLPEVKKFIATNDMREVCRSAPEYVFPFFTVYSYRGENILHLFEK